MQHTWNLRLNPLRVDTDRHARPRRHSRVAGSGSRGPSAEGFDFLAAVDEGLGEIRDLVRQSQGGPHTFEEAWLAVREARQSAALNLELWCDWNGVKAQKRGTSYAS